MPKINQEEYEKSQMTYFDRKLISEYECFTKEREETEVKTKGELIEKWESYKNGARTVADSKAIEYADRFIDDLNRLDEPEVLSQELPTIPKFVAEFLDGKEDYMLHELFDDEWLYGKHDQIAKWLYDNDEYINREREADLALAHMYDYEVEEDQKYYVIDDHNIYLLAKDEERNKVETVAKLIEIYGYDHVELNYQLTEQEIKDYGKRYWAFAEPVEVTEFRLSF